MFNKIVIIARAMNDFTFESYRLSELKKHNVDLEIWELEPSGMHFSFLDDCVMKKVNSQGELDAKLGRSDKNTLFFDFCGMSLNTFYIYRLFLKHKIKYANLVSSLPIGKIENNKWPSFGMFFLKIFSIIFIKNFILRILLKVFNYQAPSYTMVFNSCSEPNVCDDQSPKIIRLHSLDYENYQHSSRTIELNVPGVGLGRKFAVFLDDYLPFHPDYKVIGMKPLIDADYYYQKMDDFFRYVCEQLDIDIIVAAHPKSNLEHQKKLYSNYTVIQGETLNLVSKSEFVLSHSSTSVNYAVLLQKPVVFIDSDRYKPSLQKTLISVMAELLSSKAMVNLDHLDSYANVHKMGVNKKYYDEYRNSYLVNQKNADLDNWSVFFSSL